MWCIHLMLTGFVLATVFFRCLECTIDRHDQDSKLESDGCMCIDSLLSLKRVDILMEDIASWLSCSKILLVFWFHVLSMMSYLYLMQWKKKFRNTIQCFSFTKRRRVHRSFAIYKTQINFQNIYKDHKTETLLRKLLTLRTQIKILFICCWGG